MMKRCIPVSMGALVWVAWGCSPAAETTPQEQKDVKSPIVASKAEEGTKEEKPSTPSVPDFLKHDGYHYYGLGVPGKLVYTFTQDKQAPVEVSQKITLKSVDAEKKAVFEILREGFPGGNVTDTVEATPEGVFSVSTSQGVFKKPSRELPQKLSPGYTWDINAELEQAGTTQMKIQAQQKVQPTEKIKVAAGEFECIPVALSGTFSGQGVEAKIVGKTWYAKGVGMVKQEVTRSAGGQEAKILLELKKRPS